MGIDSIPTRILECGLRACTEEQQCIYIYFIGPMEVSYTTPSDSPKPPHILPFLKLYYHEILEELAIRQQTQQYESLIDVNQKPNGYNGLS